MMFYMRMSIELYIKYLCNIELCVVCEDLRKQYMLFTEKLIRFFLCQDLENECCISSKIENN